MNELYHYGRKGMKWGQDIFSNVAEKIRRYNSLSNSFRGQLSQEQTNRNRRAILDDYVRENRRIEKENEPDLKYNIRTQKYYNDLNSNIRVTNEALKTQDHTDAMRLGYAKLDAKDDNEWNYFKKSDWGKRRARNRWQNAVGNTMRGYSSAAKKAVDSYKSGMNTIKKRIKERLGR